MTFIAEDILNTHPPTEIVFCPFCKKKMTAVYEQGTRLLYTCINHKPLIIDYYYANVPPGKWTNDIIIISNSNSFRLYWNYVSSGDNFYLQEYEKTISGQRLGGWYGYKSTSFPIDWVLSQTPARIISLLEMYKVFS